MKNILYILFTVLLIPLSVNAQQESAQTTVINYNLHASPDLASDNNWEEDPKRKMGAIRIAPFSLLTGRVSISAEFRTGKKSAIDIGVFYDNVARVDLINGGTTRFGHYFGATVRYKRFFEWGQVQMVEKNRYQNAGLYYSLGVQGGESPLADGTRYRENRLDERTPFVGLVFDLGYSNSYRGLSYDFYIGSGPRYNTNQITTFNPENAESYDVYSDGIVISLVAGIKLGFLL